MTLAAFDPATLPRFSAIKPNEIEPTIKALIEKNRAKLQTLLAQPHFTWDNLMHPLEEMNNELNNTWSPISHLHSVMATDELREAFDKAQVLLTEYHSEMSQNETLFKAISALSKSPEYENYSDAQKKILENDLRDFKLAGIHLSKEKKARLAALDQELSQQTTRFANNLLDATNAWTLHITDAKQLQGLPPQAMQLAEDSAKERGLTGYVLTLDVPSYSTAIRFLDNRDIRKQLYEAYATRASDMGPDAGKWDNTQIMYDILRVRHERAHLVGFHNYAEFSLATKMAKAPMEVLDFLNDLAKRSRPYAMREYDELIALAKQDGIEKAEAWDLAYYSEKLQLSRFHFTQEEIRPYFPIDKVLKGLFTVSERLYGITISEDKSVETWHPQVKFYALHDKNKQLQGGFYLDLYARPHKNSGAWVDECHIRYVTGDKTQHPVAFLTCNFMRPLGSQPALLTHDDVITLFHEFGHCLHHMLSRVDVPSLSGMNGVPWDAVEFPSQMMENFCWEKEAIGLMSEHYETRAPIPDDLFNNMVAAKHFETGMQMLRQLEFSLFDFHLHLEFDPGKPASQVQTMINRVREQVGVYPVPSFNRFQHSFLHIFAGSYAAGYYSYKWAEVLSADAYAAFEEHGLFDPEIGRSFLENILEVGGVRDPMDAFVAFRGRKPSIEALLRQSGIK